MAQARARPGQARIPGPGPGLGFLKPKPDEARPEPWFRAKPSQHITSQFTTRSSLLLLKPQTLCCHGYPRVRVSKTADPRPVPARPDPKTRRVHPNPCSSLAMELLHLWSPIGVKHASLFIILTLVGFVGKIVRARNPGAVPV
ncbi:hypothetical protein B0H11DRAFT_1928886 [Mycena galericulata]|nr:hypothetical protein B0H11DRAFT_1928886 [Mycena galericulata]